MLKGSMKIELTDIHSGECETVLETNMVTDALAEIFRPLGHAKSTSKLLSSYPPYYQNLLGGLLLFDTAIPEEADNFFPPATAKLVGCGAYGDQNNTLGTARGGYNQNESEFNINNRFVKYVYDFTTSQANGTIASVCLTHKNGGYTSYGSSDAEFTTSYPMSLTICDGYLQYVNTAQTGANTNDKYTSLTLGVTENLFVIDRATDAAYYFRINTSTSISIIKRKAYLKSVSLLENPYYEKPFIEEIVLPTLPTAMATNYFAFNFDTANNTLYIFSSSASKISPNGSILITAIAFDTWTITQTPLVNTTSVNLISSGTRYGYVHQGYVYLKYESSPYDIYKFELGNSANVVKLALVGVTSMTGSPQIGINGRVYFENAGSNSTYYSLLIANESTNEISKPENKRICGSSYLYSFTPVLNEPLLYFVSYGSLSTIGFVMLTNYLATINNLTEPVVKTADKTMKITYIIQEQ